MKLLFGIVCMALLQAQDLPLALLPSPDGKFVLVLDSGSTPGIRVLDPGAPSTEVSRLALPDAWLGLAFAKDKKTIYASGGARGSVFEIAYSPEGMLALKREMKAADFVGDVQLSPDGRLIYAADVFANLIAVINPQSGRVIDRFKTGRRPYRILFHPDGKSYFVSSWADAAVYQYNADNGEEIGRIRLGPHTTDMVMSAYQPMLEEGDPRPDWKYRLFVAAANTNSVYAVGISENKSMRVLDTIDVAPETNSALGMTPSALALSPDQQTLYVACADAQTIVSVDVSGERGAVDDFWPVSGAPGAISSQAGRILAAVSGNPGLVQTTAENFGAAPPEIAVSARLVAPPPARQVEHVVYLLHAASPVELMQSIAGLAPDFTVKLSRQAKFDLADPANTPPAGYLWTNALAAGMTVQIYGVLMKDGKSIDPAVRQFSDADVKNFFTDLKEGESSGDMPRLVILQAPDAEAQKAVVDAVKASRFGSSTEIVTEDLGRVEALLGLKPMTRRDAIRH